jgi:hypothetical protein
MITQQLISNFAHLCKDIRRSSSNMWSILSLILIVGFSILANFLSKDISIAVVTEHEVSIITLNLKKIR